jgi:hypothetical protein
MSAIIRESTILKQEGWRIFELLKRINQFSGSVGNVGSITMERQLVSEGLSQWRVKFGGEHIRWNQKEWFSDKDVSVAFRMMDGDFENLEGELKLDGANGKTQLDLTLSIDWKQNNLSQEGNATLERKTRLAVRKWLHQIRYNASRGELKQTLEKIGVDHVETFLGVSLPKHITEGLKGTSVLAELDQQQIMKIIDFSPPFLKIQKMVITTSGDSQAILQSRSLGMGLLTQADTDGHYHETIFLAVCGQLMASAASIHLAALFPKSAPQVIEANGVKPLAVFPKGMKLLLNPAKDGTLFFVESSLVRKKMQLVVATSRISFCDIQYGVIEELKLILTPASSIRSAVEIGMPTGKAPDGF